MICHMYTNEHDVMTWTCTFENMVTWLAHDTYT